MPEDTQKNVDAKKEEAVESKKAAPEKKAEPPKAAASKKAPATKPASVKAATIKPPEVSEDDASLEAKVQNVSRVSNRRRN